MSRQSILKIADNSGITYATILSNPKGYINKGINLGSIVVIFPWKYVINKKVKRQKYYAWVTNLKKITKRKNGNLIYFYGNKALTIDSNDKFLGTRVDGPISKENRTPAYELRFKKIISYSRGTL